jgi:hypothetical protein
VVILHNQTVTFLEDANFCAAPTIEGVYASSEDASLDFFFLVGHRQSVTSGLLCYHLVHLQVSIPHKVGTHCHDITALRTYIGGSGDDAITAIIKVGEFIIEHNLSVTVRASKIHINHFLSFRCTNIIAHQTYFVNTFSKKFLARALGYYSPNFPSAR